MRSNIIEKTPKPNLVGSPKIESQSSEKEGKENISYVEEWK